MGRLTRAPAFWAAGRRPPWPLLPIAALWGLIAGRRMRRAPSVLARVPVIAVGNFTAGGAGKTPVTAALVRATRAAGFSPVVMTRGFGGRLAGPVRVDPSRHSAEDVGDEPLLHARIAPTVVARDRAAGLALVAECGGDLVILDDGFQNPTLAKDLSLVVVDRGFGLGNGRVMPAGPLRAPLADQLDRTSALVLVGSGEADAPGLAGLAAEARRRGLPMLEARLEPLEPERSAGRRLVAWAGIGRPEKFAATLRGLGADVVDLVAFSDHQRLDERDAEALLDRASAVAAELVTTEKDAVRIGGATTPALMRLALASRVAAVEVVFDDDAAVAALVGRLRRS